MENERQPDRSDESQNLLDSRANGTGEGRESGQPELPQDNIIPHSHQSRSLYSQVTAQYYGEPQRNRQIEAPQVGERLAEESSCRSLYGANHFPYGMIITPSAAAARATTSFENLSLFDEESIVRLRYASSIPLLEPEPRPGPSQQRTRPNIASTSLPEIILKEYVAPEPRPGPNPQITRSTTASNSLPGIAPETEFVSPEPRSNMESTSSPEIVPETEFVAPELRPRPKPQRTKSTMASNSLPGIAPETEFVVPEPRPGPSPQRTRPNIASNSLPRIAPESEFVAPAPGIGSSSQNRGNLAHISLSESDSESDFESPEPRPGPVRRRTYRPGMTDSDFSDSEGPN